MTEAPNINPWLKCRQSTPHHKLTLLCFPFAGGSAVIYHTWHDMLPSSIRLCPVQLPGRAERLREQPMTDMSALLDAVETALGPYLNQPIALYGHSMGGFLAYELGRRLMLREDASFVHLIVSGLISPDHAYAGPFLSQVSDTDFKQALHNLNGTPPEILEHEELFTLLLPALRADFALIENYRYAPEPVLTCPVTVLGAHDDPRTTLEKLESWQSLSSGPMDLHMMEGDHFFINSAREEVVRLITHALVPHL